MVYFLINIMYNMLYIHVLNFLYGIQCSDYHSMDNEIFYRYYLCEEAEAVGVFNIIVQTDNENVNFLMPEYLIVDKESAEGGVWISNVSNGTYFIMSYEIKCNGTNYIEGLPAYTTTISVNGTFLGRLHAIVTA